MGTTITIEIPSDVEQNHLESLEKNLNTLDGVEIDLIKSKSIIATTLLVIAIVKGGMEATKAIIEVAKSLHDFLHSKENKNDKSKKDFVITTKDGRRVEINNLSVKEIEDILANG